jgi:hypothetical protein
MMEVTCGPLVSLYKSLNAATKAAKANHLYRVLELKHRLDPGTHINPLVDQIQSKGVDR